MDFSFITKMISPSKGIEMLKAGIEAIVKEPVNHFEITYLNRQEEIWFRVWLSKGELLKQYEGSNLQMIVFAVKNLAKMNLKENETLDIVKCEHLEDGKINLDICTTKDGIPMKTQILNYKP